MNEKEKSLKLAKLMKWDVTKLASGILAISSEKQSIWKYKSLCPYESHQTGRTRFADILLRFPEVMMVW